MDESDIPEQVDHGRRRFLCAVPAVPALAVGAAELGMTGSAEAKGDRTRRAGAPAVTPGTKASFGPVKQVKAGVLNVGYVAAGPAGGRAVILMHGFPYDIHSYVEVAPLLAAEGYRFTSPPPPTTAPQRPSTIRITSPS